MNKLNIYSFLRPSFLLIFSAVLFATLTDQFITHQVERVISSKDGLSNMIFVWGGLSILSAILFPLLNAMVCSFSLAGGGKSFSRFIGDNLELGFIEILRAWGKTFLWAFVFIMPAFRKYVHFLLTPYVVFFSRAYREGKVDALEYSAFFAKKVVWWITLYTALFYVVVPLVVYALLDDYKVFRDHPASATAIVMVQAALELSFHYLMLKIFFKHLNEVENNGIAV